MGSKVLRALWAEQLRKRGYIIYLVPARGEPPTSTAMERILKRELVVVAAVPAPEHPVDRLAVKARRPDRPLSFKVRARMRDFFDVHNSVKSNQAKQQHSLRRRAWEDTLSSSD